MSAGEGAVPEGAAPVPGPHPLAAGRMSATIDRYMKLGKAVVDLYRATQEIKEDPPAFATPETIHQQETALMMVFAKAGIELPDGQPNRVRELADRLVGIAKQYQNRERS